MGSSRRSPSPAIGWCVGVQCVVGDGDDCQDECSGRREVAGVGLVSGGGAERR